MSKGNWVQKDASCGVEKKKRDIIPGWLQCLCVDYDPEKGDCEHLGYELFSLPQVSWLCFLLVLGLRCPAWHALCHLPAQWGQKGLSTGLEPHVEQQALALPFTGSRAGLNWSRGSARRNSDRLSPNGGVCVCEMARRERGDSEWPLEILDICVGLWVWDKLLTVFCPV